MRPIAIAVVLLLSVTSLSAADLGSHTKWIDSPEAYFATKAEREQWSKLGTEAEAARFIADFRDRRGPEFAAEVKDRVANADKYLTIADVPGSRTLRGRVVVLFGPPSGLSTADRTKSNTKRDNPIMAGALSNVGTAGSGSRTGDDSSNISSALATANAFRTFTISYAGKPAEQVGQKELTFILETDVATGKDRFLSRKAEKEAEALFERAAEASIRK